MEKAITKIVLSNTKDLAVGIQKVLFVTQHKSTEAEMDNLNHIFFEEYKSLDELCRQIYGSQPGVTHYIDDMKSVPEKNYRHIPNWKDDLQQLIRIRHIRNDLAHRQGAFDEKICTQKEIEWTREFHERILKRADPLAILRQYSEIQHQMINSRGTERIMFVTQESSMFVQNDDEGGEMKTFHFVMILIFIVTVVLLMALLSVFMEIALLGNL